MTADVATGARETVGKNAALEVFTEGLFDVSWWRVMVALAIKLACAGQFKPCLEMTGDGFIEQSLFGMAGAVQGAMQAGTLMRRCGSNCVAAGRMVHSHPEGDCLDDYCTSEQYFCCANMAAYGAWSKSGVMS